MTEEQEKLLKKARDEFPIGQKVLSPSGYEFIIDSRPPYFGSDGIIYNGNGTGHLYRDGRWATKPQKRTRLFIYLSI